MYVHMYEDVDMDTDNKVVWDHINTLIQQARLVGVVRQNLIKLGFSVDESNSLVQHFVIDAITKDMEEK